MPYLYNDEDNAPMIEDNLPFTDPEEPAEWYEEEKDGKNT